MNNLQNARRNKTRNIEQVSIKYDSLLLIGSTATKKTLGETQFQLTVVPKAAGISSGVALTSKVAGVFLNKKGESSFLYTFSRNTAQDKNRIVPRSLEDTELTNQSLTVLLI